MPAYISHAIMIDKFYQESYRDNKIIKNDLDLDELKTYSLGSDLASLSKKLNNNPHRKYTKAFFMNLIRYIKENDLVDNIHVIDLLYGHLAHYYLDVLTHPFIYYLSEKSKNVSFIPAHQLIEGYLDSYLCENILHKDIMDINYNYFNKANMNIIGVRNILNQVYGKIYGDNDIIKTYKDTIKILTTIETILKSPIFSKSLLINISGFKDFLRINNLTINDLNNELHNDYHNPITNDIDNKSFIEMFYMSIDMLKEAIIEINKYLYGDKSISFIENIFEDLSYDTGVSCDLGHNMVYAKKYN